jgi:N-acyl amino acid synthase of PEP-CTERM/exosortase system
MPNIIDTFDHFFEMVPAVSEPLLQEVYKLRYQVYCIETGFEDPTSHPGQIEYDEFDSNSIHYLIRHKRFNTYAATTRLILPDTLHPEKLFPIELHTQIDNHTALEKIPRTKLAEVSRFCVSKDFKKRKKESGTLTGVSQELDVCFTEDERRTFPHITIALIACLIKMSAEYNVEYWFAVMEPALLRFLSTLGIHFTQIGPLVDYRGIRQPSVIKVSYLLDGVAGKHPELWEMLTMRGEFSRLY